MLKKGQGWRLGWRDDNSLYPALIGASTWALELTKAEMTDFCRLLPQLADSISAMTEYLMAEETISCEVETPLMWLGADGYCHHYAVRIILHTARGAEGYWEAEAIPELLSALQSLKSY